jgi:hypothetical protein
MVARVHVLAHSLAGSVPGSVSRCQLAHSTSSAPAETLFRLETDGANWSSWAKPIVVQSGWARRSDSAPGGVGAIRKVGMRPVLVQEETVEYEVKAAERESNAGQ